MKRFFYILAHIFFALFIAATAVPLLLHGRDGVYPMASAGSVIMVLLSTNFRPFRNIKASQLIFFLICCFFFLVSSLSAQLPFEKEAIKSVFLFYMVAGLGALLIVNYQFDLELFLRSLILIALVISPVVLTTNYSIADFEVDNDEWMGTIYAITPFIVACIFYLFSGNARLFKVLSVICMVLYFSMFIMHTPRGAVVTVAAAIVVCAIQRWLEKGWAIKHVILLSILLIVFIILSANYLLIGLQTLADKYDLRWLGKFVFAEDISNNRVPLYEEAWGGFLRSPIWGNGVATFHNFSGYPHNLFLQMLYETGLLMVVPISYLLLRAFGIMIKRVSLCGIDYRFITFYFIISFNQLMFSSFFWRSHCFWLLIWSVIAIVVFQRKNNNANIVYSQKKVS